MTMWSYDIPNEPHEGWTKMMISQNGMFAAVSDFGDYVRYWKGHGLNDFRTFFTNVIGRGDNLLEKLSRREFSEARTRHNIYAWIKRAEFPETMMKDLLKMAKEACLDDIDLGDQLSEIRDYAGEDFLVGEMRGTEYPLWAHRFVYECLPRVEVRIRQELGLQPIGLDVMAMLDLLRKDPCLAAKYEKNDCAYIAAKALGTLTINSLPNLTRLVRHSLVIAGRYDLLEV